MVDAPEGAPKRPARGARAPRATPVPDPDAAVTSPLPPVVPVDEPAPPVAAPQSAAFPPEPATMPVVPPSAAAPAQVPHPAPQPHAPRPPRPAPAYASPPTAQAVNPLAGTRPADVLRDVVAAFLLLLSLGLRWDAWRDATARVDVVLITLLSVFSLAVPYLGRLGAIGGGWTTARIRLARLLLNAPYLVMVVVYLVLDAVRGGELGIEGGIGAAVGVGLAGALLAAQPREAELAVRPDGARPGGAWRWVVAAIGAVIAAGAIGGLVATLVRERDDLTLTGLLVAVLATLLTLTLVAAPVVGAVAGSPAWRIVLVGLGAAAIVLLLLADRGVLLRSDVESVHLTGFGWVLWPAAAAAALAPGLRLGVDHGPRARWFGAAVGLLTLVAVTCVLQVALAVVRLTDDASEATDARGSLVAVLVLTVLYLMGVLIARGALAQNQPQATAVVVVVAATLLLVGLVQLAVVSASDALTVTFVDQALALVVPVVLAVAVAVPAFRGAAGPSRSGPTTSLPPRT